MDATVIYYGSVNVPEADLARLRMPILGIFGSIDRIVPLPTVTAFQDTMAQTLMIYVSFFVTFACVLAFGVPYNAARISLSERSRELATLRVLRYLVEHEDRVLSKEELLDLPVRRYVPQSPRFMPGATPTCTGAGARAWTRWPMP